MRINGILRMLPVLLPRVVKMITGLPRSVLPSRPPVDSYVSTWSRTHFSGLATYWLPIAPTLPRAEPQAVHQQVEHPAGQFALGRVGGGEGDAGEAGQYVEGGDVRT